LWRHPISGQWVRFGKSTIEKWYYQAQAVDNPIDQLRRQVRSDAGQTRVMSAQLLSELHAQYKQHPSWSCQLHSDNLAALVQENPFLGPAVSYSTVRRRMKQQGWLKKPHRRNPTEGMIRADERLQKREVRSYEVQYVHQLWHFDYHECSRQVAMANGSWHTPQLLGILDDFSRWCCHAQWYLKENTETLCHGHQQAFIKRGLPRSELSDNGSAMRAEETQNGFESLSINHERTLEYSPYQNAKQEVFWNSQIEGRLMPMLENVEPLTLDFLNKATQAFVEQHYNRTRHEELGTSPLQRALDSTSVARPCPSLATMQLYFTVKQTRMLRRSDCTISIQGVRFEIPSRLRTMSKLWVRYQRWDLSQAYVVDPRDHRVVIARIFPLNKQQNSDGRRRVLDSVCEPDLPEKSGDPVPPLLRKLLSDYAQSGLPPAYIPLEDAIKSQEDNDDE
jgi:transposase InsO family protein